MPTTAAGCPELVELLLEYGARYPSLPMKGGKTSPLQVSWRVLRTALQQRLGMAGCCPASCEVINTALLAAMGCRLPYWSQCNQTLCHGATAHPATCGVPRSCSTGKPSCVCRLRLMGCHWGHALRSGAGGSDAADRHH